VGGRQRPRGATAHHSPPPLLLSTMAPPPGAARAVGLVLAACVFAVHAVGGGGRACRARAARRWGGAAASPGSRARQQAFGIEARAWALETSPPPPPPPLHSGRAAVDRAPPHRGLVRLVPRLHRVPHRVGVRRRGGRGAAGGAAGDARCVGGWRAHGATSALRGRAWAAVPAAALGWWSGSFEPSRGRTASARAPSHPARRARACDAGRP